MRRKKYIQQLVLSIFCVVWTLGCLCLQYVVKNTFLTGVKPSEITCVTQVQQVEYTVVAVRQVTDSNGRCTYRVTFRDDGNTAPECTVELETLIAGMDIGATYTAQWLRVSGQYSDYTRTKDNITMQFAQDSADNTVVQMLRQDVTNALVTDLQGLVRWYYYVELIIIVLVYFVVVMLLPKLSNIVADKLFVPSDIDYAQSAIDRVLEEKTPESIVEVLNKNVETVDNYVTAVKRRVYAQQHKADVKELTGDKAHTQDIEQIDVPMVVAKQQRIQRRERAKHAITPIAADIVIDVDNI